MKSNTPWRDVWHEFLLLLMSCTLDVWMWGYSKLPVRKRTADDLKLLQDIHIWSLQKRPTEMHWHFETVKAEVLMSPDITIIRPRR